jgi:DNA modification methylase
MIYNEDCLTTMSRMEDNSIDLIVTSPPYNNWRNKRVQKSREDYWKRTRIDYDNFDDKMSDEDYENWQIKILNECIRVLKPTGTICYNHKDTIYNFEVTSPLQWIMKSDAKLRQTVIWDRCGMQAYNPVRYYRFEEYVYVLGKGQKNFKWNKECARYGSIWRIPPSRNKHGHPATFPEELVKRCVESFTDSDDIVYDPFMGSGTTAIVCKSMNRQYIGSEISKNYCETAENRLL